MNKIIIKHTKCKNSHSICCISATLKHTKLITSALFLQSNITLEGWQKVINIQRQQSKLPGHSSRNFRWRCIVSVRWSLSASSSHSTTITCRLKIYNNKKLSYFKYLRNNSSKDSILYRLSYEDRRWFLY